MGKIERRFWQHLPSENVWAVETDDQQPVKCVGPLDIQDVDEMLLPHLDFSTRYVYVIEADWSLYVRYVLCSACGKVIRFGATTASNGATGRVHLDCAMNPPAIQGESVGAGLLMESLWQRSARLRHSSVVLTRNSKRLQERCRLIRLKYPLSLN